MLFEFQRLTLRFRARDVICFPPGPAGNILRGALGTLLRSPAPDPLYTRLFDPRAESDSAPSGLRDQPRPFVFRAASLDGRHISPGAEFGFDLHLFDLREPPVAPGLVKAFERLADEGIGRARGRAALMAADPHSQVLDLDWRGGSVHRVQVQFVTPTELKTASGLAARPDFGVLFARLRDRISALRALYGPGPLEIDFRAIGDRASQVRLVDCDLQWQHFERHSTKTGQRHPLGGFTGRAEYEGESLGEFVPYLEAGRWVGVGRQAVWGKGEIHVALPSQPRA